MYYAPAYQTRRNASTGGNLGYILAFIVAIVIILIVGAIAIIAMFNAPKSGTRDSLAKLTKDDKDDKNDDSAEEDDKPRPDKFLCVTSGNTDDGRNYVFPSKDGTVNDDKCSGTNQHGWTPVMDKIKVFSREVPNTQKYCILGGAGLGYLTPANGGSCQFGGWHPVGSFYAYPEPEEDTDEICVFEAMGPQRINVQKNNCNKPGWRKHLSFYVPK